MQIPPLTMSVRCVTELLLLNNIIIITKLLLLYQIIILVILFIQRHLFVNIFGIIDKLAVSDIVCQI